MKNNNFTSQTVVTGLSSLMITFAVNAQQTTNKYESLESLEDSVVIGSHMPGDWWRPIEAVSSIDGEALQAAAYDFKGVLEHVAGGYNGAPLQGTFSLRGWNQDTPFGNVSTGSSYNIATLTQGVPNSVFSLRFLPPSLWDVENVDVWKGSQIANQGMQSLAGMMSFRYRDPSFDNFGRMRVEVAERGKQKLDLTQNMVVIPNELALRFNYELERTNGTVKNSTLLGRDWGENEVQRLRAQALWHPQGDEDTSLSLLLGFSEGRGNPVDLSKETAGQSLFQHTIDANRPAFYISQYWWMALEYEKEFANGNHLINTVGISDFSNTQTGDLDFGPVLDWNVRRAVDEQHFFEHFGLSGERNNLKWGVGATLQYSDYHYGFQGNGLAPGILGAPFYGATNENVFNAALYGKFDKEFAKNWHLQGQLRLLYDRKKVHTGSQIGGGSLVRDNRSISDTAFLPSLGISWRPDEDTSLGVRLARGYRGGGVSHAPITGVVQGYAPEHSWETEIHGRKYLTDDLRLSGSLFYTKLDDVQVPSDVMGGIPTIDTIVSNSGKANRYGAELELDWQLKENWKLRGTVSYIRTEFDDLNISGVDRSGLAFPNAPKWTASVAVSYDKGEGVFGNAGFSWAGESYTQITNPELTRLESRAVLSAKIGYKKDNWKVYAFANNILNDDFAYARMDYSALGAGVIGKASEPISFGVGFEIKW